MLFLSKFVIWLLSPLGMVFCLAGLALALAWRRRLRGSMAIAALAAGFVVSAFLYSASYARLTQFRWCIGAPTMRAPALAAAQSDVP